MMHNQLTGNEDFESNIMDKMNQLGYKIDKKGICCGLKMAWIQSSLIGQSNKIYERIKLIYNTPDLLQKIKLAQSKGKDLTEEDQNLINILAFFDAIKLYQGVFYAEGFDKFIFQYSDLDIVSNMIMPKELEDRGGIAKLCFTKVMGNSQEIENFLIGLKSTLQNVGGENADATVFSLSGLMGEDSGHSTGFRYDFDADRWIFFNSNQPALSEKKLTDGELVLEIMKAYKVVPVDTMLLANVPVDKKIKMGMDILTTGNTKNILKESFDKFATTISSAEIQSNILSGDFSFLRLAFSNENQETFKKALLSLDNNGFDWNAPDKNGNTIAHRILKSFEGKYFLSTLNEPIKNKIDWTKQNNVGATPVHYAVGSASYESLAWFINNIKDWNKANNNGKTPAMLAVTNGDIHALKLMSSDINWATLCPNGDTYADYAIKNDKISVLEFLVKKGIDLNAPNKNGLTPLHFAASQGKLDAFYYLAQQNIDWNKKDNNGNTPVHHLANIANIDTVNFLIRIKDIDWNIENDKGQTPVSLLLEKAVSLREELQGLPDDSEEEEKEQNSELAKFNEVLKLIANKGVDLDKAAQIVQNSDVWFILKEVKKSNEFNTSSLSKLFSSESAVSKQEDEVKMERTLGKK